MTALDFYGMGALGLLGLVFCFVRSVPAYLVLASVVIGAFVVGTPLSTTGLAATRIVMTTGLVACAVGLLIVRVMLVRSVSLQLLGRLDGARSDVFTEDIRGRLHDMRAFHLVRTLEGVNMLTTFGKLVSGVVAASYSVFRIRS
jgi:high-affinity Fe2+/Pb2+ permease